ncbi:hypothetical protein D3C72_1940680 [compost metagenome]
MVAAFYRQREVVAELARHGIGPGAERDDHLMRLERPLGGRHPPARTFENVLHRRRVPGNQASAERLEIAEIGLVEAVRVTDRPGVAPAQAADEIGLDGRLQGLQFAGREFLVVDAETSRQFLGILVGGVALLLGAEDLHPAVLADQVART